MKNSIEIPFGGRRFGIKQICQKMTRIKSTQSALKIHICEQYPVIVRKDFLIMLHGEFFDYNLIHKTARLTTIIIIIK